MEYKFASYYQYPFIWGGICQESAKSYQRQCLWVQNYRKLPVSEPYLFKQYYSISRSRLKIYFIHWAKYKVTGSNDFLCARYVHVLVSPWSRHKSHVPSICDAHLNNNGTNGSNKVVELGNNANFTDCHFLL